MDCSICVEPMLTKSFDKELAQEEDCVDSLDKACLRMKCGHAFHVPCITQSLRNNIGCPFCKETAEVVVMPDLLSEGDSESDERIREIDNTRFLLRTTSEEIMQARHELNKSVKTYRKFSEVLKRERKLHIKAALKTFRSKHRSEFKKYFRDVEQKIETVKEIEIKELCKTNAEEDVEDYMTLMMEFDYDARTTLASADFTAVDPLLNRFWKIT